MVNCLKNSRGLIKVAIAFDSFRCSSTMISPYVAFSASPTPVRAGTSEGCPIYGAWHFQLGGTMETLKRTTNSVHKLHQNPETSNFTRPKLLALRVYHLLASLGQGDFPFWSNKNGGNLIIIQQNLGWLAYILVRRHKS
jgi:hypothetical protein